MFSLFVAFPFAWRTCKEVRAWTYKLQPPLQAVADEITSALESKAI